ncbi:MAG: hypothetical protein KC940_26640, partial [Candidatus Omnitrophica bacterium]|nr:hypothetical protein [Candidatus Omnitrophota bacterium]
LTEKVIKRRGDERTVRRVVCGEINKHFRRIYGDEWPRIEPNHLSCHIYQHPYLSDKIDTTTQGVMLTNFWSSLESAQHWTKRNNSIHENKIQPKAKWAIREVNQSLINGDMSGHEVLDFLQDVFSEVNSLIESLKISNENINMTLNLLDRKPVLQLVERKEAI